MRTGTARGMEWFGGQFSLIYSPGHGCRLEQGTPVSWSGFTVPDDSVRDVLDVASRKADTTGLQEAEQIGRHPDPIRRPAPGGRGPGAAYD